MFVRRARDIGTRVQDTHAPALGIYAIATQLWTPMFGCQPVVDTHVSVPRFNSGHPCLTGWRGRRHRGVPREIWWVSKTGPWPTGALNGRRLPPRRARQNPVAAPGRPSRHHRFADKASRLGTSSQVRDTHVPVPRFNSGHPCLAGWRGRRHRGAHERYGECPKLADGRAQRRISPAAPGRGETQSQFADSGHPRPGPDTKTIMGVQNFLGVPLIMGVQNF